MLLFVGHAIGGDNPGEAARLHHRRLLENGGGGGGGGDMALLTDVLWHGCWLCHQHQGLCGDHGGRCKVTATLTLTGTQFPELTHREKQINKLISGWVILTGQPPTHLLLWGFI